MMWSPMLPPASTVPPAGPAGPIGPCGPITPLVSHHVSCPCTEALFTADWADCTCALSSTTLDT